MNRQEVLEEAINLSVGKRDQEYGSPQANGLMISKMITAYKGINIEPYEHFVMMAIVKICRARHSPKKADHYIDASAYLALAAECVCAVRDEPLKDISEMMEDLSKEEKQRLIAELEREDD